MAIARQLVAALLLAAASQSTYAQSSKCNSVVQLNVRARDHRTAIYFYMALASRVVCTLNAADNTQQGHSGGL